MTDYYRLIAHAVADLRNADEAGRAALYECARAALVSQLSSLTPPLPESEIARESLSLEKAICDIEANSTRRPRAEAACPVPAPTPPGQPEQEPSSGEQGRPPAGRRELSAGGARPRPPTRSGPECDETGTDDLELQVESRAGNLNRPSLSAQALEALKLYREGVAKAERAGEAELTAPEARAHPGNVPHRDPFEPRIEPRDLRVPSGPVVPRVGGIGPRMEMRQLQSRPIRQRQAAETIVSKPPGRSRRTLIAACLGLSLVIVLAIVLHWQRDRLIISTVFAPNLAAPAEHEAAPSQPEVLGSIDRASQQASSATDPTPTAGLPEEHAAQRALRYEEEPADANGRRYAGWVTWQTEPVSPRQPLAVRAQLQIPERHISMTMSLRPNSDKTLHASHTIDIVFKVPSDFPFGGISNVLGILMKEAEQTRGAPLALTSVKITTGVFLIGLSAADSDMQRNWELLDGRSWFDIPIVYNNGRRAILAIEKGTPGQRVFKEAFAARK